MENNKNQRKKVINKAIKKNYKMIVRVLQKSF